MNIKTKMLYFFKGNLIAKFFAFFAFFILAKVVSSETFATYSIYLFVSEILLMGLTYGLNSYILRNSCEKLRLETFPKSIFIIIFSFLIFGIFIILASPILAELLPESYTILLEYKYLILFTLLNKSFINMCFGYFISNHKAQNHMRINIVNPLSFLVVLLINYFILNLNNLDLIFYSLFISSMIAAMNAYLLIKEINFIQRINLREMLLLIKESSPFLIKNIIGIVGLYLSRLILDSMATKEELAIYSFYLIIIFQLSFFTRIVSQSIIPTLRDNIEKLERNSSKINNYLKKYLFISLGIFLATLIISFLIYNNSLPYIEHMVKKEYLKDIFVFNILLLSFLIGSLTTIFNVWQFHEAIKIKKVLILMSLSNILIGFIVYPIGYKLFSIYGVAIGYVII